MKSDAVLPSSFIEPLLPRIVEAYRSAIPERADLVELLEEQLAAIDVADRLDGFAALPGFGIISASWWALETLWCCAFSMAALGPFFDQALLKEERELDPLISAEAFIAQGLLNWAARTAERGERLEWMHANVGWPYQGADPDLFLDDAVIVRAETVFLGAVGWILLHEIAHLHLDHGASDRPVIDLEREADETATRWLFELAPFGDASSRGEGLVCAILYMWMREFQGDVPDHDHPSVGERLDACMIEAKLAPNAWPKCLINAVGDMFFQQRGVQTPATMRMSFDTCDQALAELISTVQRHNKESSSRS